MMETMTATYRFLLFDEHRGVLRFGEACMALLDIKEGFRGLRRQMKALTDLQIPTLGVLAAVSSF
jgi:hypothetical protein